jgi:hypothetical protein
LVAGTARSNRNENQRRPEATVTGARKWVLGIKQVMKNGDRDPESLADNVLWRSFNRFVLRLALDKSRKDGEKKIHT